MKSEMNIDLANKYIMKSATSDEMKIFKNWLNMSDSNITKFENFKRNRNLINKAYEAYKPSANEAWQKVSVNLMLEKTINKNKPKTIFIHALKIAVVTLLILTIGLLTKKHIGSDFTYGNNIISYTSGKEIIQIILPDSTLVWLNTYSKLELPEKFEKARKRKVKLSGEAFFEVKKNPQHPFVIHAKGTITRVIGTSFNLRARNEENLIEMNLNTGKVDFYKKNRKANRLLLIPGEKAVYYEENRKIEKMINNDMNYLSWKTGKLEFKKSELPYILETLSKHYHTVFVFDQNQAKNYVFTGTFQNKTLEQTLEILELTLEIKFVRTENHIEVQF